MKIDGAKPGFEINSAGFSFKGHSINGHRSLVIEVHHFSFFPFPPSPSKPVSFLLLNTMTQVTASVEYSRRLEEIESDNEDIVIHGRLLAPVCIT